MADIIQLLPDAVANQIAAGEVIQRPASVVKELVENSIDAGSNDIKVIVKDGGRTLIQVIDNGCGMSETDARMSFERHATSKIKKAKDLFAIRTMGFRGEAMASIAAIAHVEMKTRQAQKELGTKLIIEGSEVKIQEACQAPAGTSISVKNLFYNVPARRKFLKSQATEMKKILDEFQRIALANPDIAFSLVHNGNEVYRLPIGNLRQRAVGVLGDNSNKKLIPVKEETDIMKIYGFIGKPEFAKKSRGEQMFFVNNRFIKSAYLNHAIVSAYENLLNEKSYPLYIIFIDIDPANVDINVHPAKQEIKFDDERLVYNYLKVTAKHALGQYSITPSLDFDQEPGLANMGTYPQSGKSSRQTTESSYNPGSQPIKQGTTPPQRDKNLQHWEKLYKGLEQTEADETGLDTPVTIASKWSDDSFFPDDTKNFTSQIKEPYQIHNQYVVSQIKSGFLLINQRAASERIYYEEYLRSLEKKQPAVQKELFPKTIEVATSDVDVLKMILPEINSLGFDIQEFGKDSFIMYGTPADLPKGCDIQNIIDTLLEQFNMNIDFKLSTDEKIARSMAKSTALKKGKKLEPEEMQELIDKLFACEIPYKSPSGKKCFITFDLDELGKMFEG